MKLTTNFIVTCIVLCMTTHYHNLFGFLSVSQYKTDSFFQKPYFLQDDFTKVSLIFSGGFASQAYTNNGTKVPFLQQFGSENLLKRFTDSSLPNNDTDSFGQGLLNGNFHVRELIVACYKNMTHGFFIEGATVIQDLFMNSISVEFAPTIIPLTQQQINYLQTLQQQLPSTIDRSGMFTTAIYGGFSKTFTDFVHLDFIDLTIKTGFTSPQAMTNNNSSILQFPFNGNLNFGYPVIATASFGIFDWITIGCNGSVTPWQSTTQNIAMNNSLSGNNLLLPQSGIATIERGPLFTSAIYFEADHFHSGLSGTIAYCYTKNCSYTITPIDQIQFPKALVNQSPIFDSWSIGSFYLQFDIDFACESAPSAPIVTVFCNIPTAGQLCPKTTMFGASYNLQVSYAF